MNKLGFLALALFLCACNRKEKVDLVLYNATIYTVDSNFSKAQAIAIRDGKIIETGTTDAILSRYDAAQSIDESGKFIYPGFIDAHAHFEGYGQSLQRVNLVGTSSWQEVVDKTKEFAISHPTGWLVGRGWDQNDWEAKEFPTNKLLNELFPDRPVLLTRIDGHASIANKAALDIAGIKPGDHISGGEIEVKSGQLTGMLVDNAVHLVSSKIPSANAEQLTKAFIDAQRNCFAVGLTTVDDCGLDADDILFIDSLQQNKLLKMRIYAMLSDAPKNFDFAFSKGKIKTPHLNVRSFKVYADGALGSRGACLLQPYSDKPNSSGFLLSSQQHFDSVANILAKNDFQMCTHAIGDSGNRTMLLIYGKYLKGKNDKRWRIEHAQVINKDDFKLFGDYSIIPSVQPTHATSDMYWASERLGPERVKGAYAYKQLLNENGWIPLGTDFPVEDISPFKTFYAAVIRKDARNWPANGFQVENALTREEAICGMTIWAAKSNFEEAEKGSLEKNKFADLVILDRDLLTTPPEQLLTISVLKTFVAGELVYEKNK